MKRHPLALFFFLAFGLPWAVWGTTLAEQAGWIAWHVPASLAFWIALPLATFGTAAVTEGWAAVREVLLRMIRVRVGGGWYALALLTTPILCGIALLVGAGLGLRPDAMAPGLGLPGLFLLNLWMFLLSEEAAWRGFALPRLERRMSPLAASVVLGLIWAGWHLPLFLVIGSFQAAVPFGGFVLSTGATSITIGWIFQGARGSVFIAALFHAATDVAIAATGVMTSGPVLFWIFVAAQCALALIAGGLLRSRPGALARTGVAQEAGQTVGR